MTTGRETTISTPRARSVRIYANKVGTVSRLASRMGVVRLIPPYKVDIGELVRKGASFDSLRAVCEGDLDPAVAVPSYRKRTMNVCYPCRCGALVITDEKIENPADVQVGPRKRVCDVCHFEFEYDGDHLVFLSVNPDGTPDWWSSGGSSELERLILRTEQWLDTNKPPEILSRLGWPDLPSFSR